MTRWSSSSEIPSPSLPLLTWMIASPRCISLGMIGISSLRITSSAVVRSRLQYKVHTVLVVDKDNHLKGIVDHYACMV